MSKTIWLIAALMTVCATTQLESADKFQPTIESLQGYECPAWFRDAKFGIYLH